MKQLIEIQLFGPIVSFIGLDKLTHIEIEQFENYQKMGYRNRFQVLSAKGVLNLTVPIVGGRDQKSKTSDVEVDYSGRWLQEHWRTLESNYNRSPFFEHYAPSLKQLWDSRPQMLSEFCEHSLRWVVKQLKWTGTISHSNNYAIQVEEGVLDLRNKYLPKNRLMHSLPSYQQQFGNQFEPNLSILDLLFNNGPLSSRYLQGIQKPSENNL
ncbi:MAG TPA: WbqC family protein [Phnomibacter sp.]|nr:WbqC family protein [Phnomibacter sp.]